MLLWLNPDLTMEMFMTIIVDKIKHIVLIIIIITINPVKLVIMEQHNLMCNEGIRSAPIFRKVSFM